MNKKAFTLVEIIICITLIVTISAITIINLQLESKDKLETITKKILEAAEVYVNTTKDSNGKEYLQEINKGAKGLQLSVTTLVDNGLIDEKTVNELYDIKNVKKNNNQSYYVLFLSDGTDYCDKNEITVLSSWMEEGKTIYLCKNYNNSNNINSTPLEINKNTKFKVDLTKFAVSEDFAKNHTKSKSILTSDENGLYTYYNESTKNIYTYYRGAVNNNYVKLGEIDGNPLYWRILWIRDDNQMKLVLDETIPIYVTTTEGEKIEVQKNDQLYTISKSNRYNTGYTYTTLNPKCSTRCGWEPCNRYTDRYTTCEIDLFINHTNPYGYNANTNIYGNNIFKNTLINWYNTIDFHEISITTTNNFCVNSYYEDKSSFYYPKYTLSTNFDCTARVSYNLGYGGLVSSQVGFITYGEVLRAGIIENSELSDVPDNFLLNNGSDFLIADKISALVNSGYWYYSNDSDHYMVKDGKLYHANIYVQDQPDGENHSQWYTLKNRINNETLINNYDVTIRDPQVLITSTYFYAHRLKPAIIVDLNGFKLSSSDGTKDNAYTILPE